MTFKINPKMTKTDARNVTEKLIFQDIKFTKFVWNHGPGVPGNQ